MELPHIGELLAGTCWPRNASAAPSASASVSREARTRSMRPVFLWVLLFQESIASSTASGWCTMSSGPSASTLSWGSVTSMAISMMRSESGCSPVISMSIQIRLFGSAAMAYSTCVPNALTWLFLAALAAATATRLWLARRQIRHVSAHRPAVPASFADTIPLHAHQKAADYTAAKTRLGIVDTLLGALLVLVLTLGAGVQWIAEAWSAVFASGSLAHGTALLLTLFFVQAIISLPLALYRVFVVEERFGFNRMTLRLFLTDLAKQTLLALALGVPLLLAVLSLMERMGEYWWLYV